MFPRLSEEMFLTSIRLINGTLFKIIEKFAMALYDTLISIIPSIYIPQRL